MHADRIFLYEKLPEAIQDAETRLLKAFLPIRGGHDKRMALHDKRMTLHDASDATLSERLGLVESRVLEIEKRLNTPPGQTA